MRRASLVQDLDMATRYRHWRRVESVLALIEAGIGVLEEPMQDHNGTCTNRFKHTWDLECPQSFVQGTPTQEQPQGTFSAGQSQAEAGWGQGQGQVRNKSGPSRARVDPQLTEITVQVHDNRGLQNDLHKPSHHPCPRWWHRTEQRSDGTGMRPG